ncbi:MAG: UDP-glucose 4-epimerase GalE [Clostridia bacterium]|nr:UDP-glucose 4-epimerase GalE [Clostridia bacterium]
MKKILVTGGTGYIGSHTVVELIGAGYEPVIIDNLSNSKEDVVDKIQAITGVRPAFYKVDILDKEGMDKVFSAHDIFAVIHFAGLKAVGESVKLPLKYYDNNITGTLRLLEVMRAHNVKNILFSSSATVYGTPKTVPIREDFPTGACTNPYGKTKYFIEEILKDLYVSDNTFNICLLRYFNPVGAHESGLIGENPNGIPNNLMPYITQVAIGIRPFLNVFGGDYPTPDGTGVRDYIHVVDLARGHLLALKKIEESANGVYVYNLGTGTGYSVLDMVKAFSEVLGRQLPYKIVERRAGDIAECYADPSKAEKELGFKAQYDLKRMCEDSWRFQQKLK